ncbi:Nitrilase [Onygenales sp. PD_10]|nr:Nitrilase [Onygenales sp. PD_10]
MPPPYSRPRPRRRTLASGNSAGRFNRRRKYTRPPAKKPRVGFFSLPYELRCLIYKELLVLDNCIDDTTNLARPLDKLVHLAVLGVNRRIRAEALETFLGENVWVHFRIGRLIDREFDCADEFRYGTHYNQPYVPVGGGGGLVAEIKDRVTAKVEVGLGLTADVAYMTVEEFEEERFFVFQRQRYELLCCMILRLCSAIPYPCDVSLSFSQQSKWARKPLIQSDLARPLIPIKQIDTFRTAHFTSTAWTTKLSETTHTHTTPTPPPYSLKTLNTHLLTAKRTADTHYQAAHCPSAKHHYALALHLEAIHGNLITHQPHTLAATHDFDTAHRLRCELLLSYASAVLAIDVEEGKYQLLESCVNLGLSGVGFPVQLEGRRLYVLALVNVQMGLCGGGGMDPMGHFWEAGRLLLLAWRAGWEGGGGNERGRGDKGGRCRLVVGDGEGSQR